MNAFVTVVAPIILGLCSGAMLWLSYRYYKAGRKFKALLDLLAAIFFVVMAITLPGMV